MAKNHNELVYDTFWLFWGTSILSFRDCLSIAHVHGARYSAYITPGWSGTVKDRPNDRRLLIMLLHQSGLNRHKNRRYTV